jgi:pantoate--beta-alanine ligase
VPIARIGDLPNETSLIVIPVLKRIDDVRTAVRAARASGKLVGLVPTMGALHDGHIRLIERCRAESGFVAVSIFVNPTQFGPHEDLERYPRPLELDIRRSSEAGADLIFAPDVDEMYPRQRGPATFVEVPGLSQSLEGAIRPGHFRGVTSVVLKLFSIVTPDLAYFGQKDFQQQVVIRRMVADLNLPLAIRTVATVREPDGLALSSRNVYLEPADRLAATILSTALSRAVTAVSAGEADADQVRQILRETVESEGRATLEYAEVADVETLESLEHLVPGQPAVALIAARVGPVRLIDNTILTAP